MKIPFQNLPEAVKSAIAENAEGNFSKDINIGQYPFYLEDILAQLACDQIKHNKFILEGNYIISGKKNLALTEKEAAIIKYLHNNKSASRAELLKNVWGYAEEADTNTVETHISRLRQKLQETFEMELITHRAGNYELL